MNTALSWDEWATCDATAVARVETPAKVTRPASVQRS